MNSRSRQSMIDPSNATNVFNRVYKSLLKIGPTEAQQLVFYNLLHLLSGPLTAPASIKDQVGIQSIHKDISKSTLYFEKPDNQLLENQSSTSVRDSAMANSSKESEFSSNSNCGTSPNYFKYNQALQNASTKSSSFEYKYPSSFLPNSTSAKGTVFTSGNTMDQFYESKVQNILHMMNNVEKDTNKNPNPSISRASPRASTSGSADIFSSAMFSLRCDDRKYYEVLCVFFISMCGQVLQYTNRVLTPFLTKIEKLAVYYWNEWRQCEKVSTLQSVVFCCVVVPFIVLGLAGYGFLWGFVFMVRLLLSNVPPHIKGQLV